MSSDKLINSSSLTGSAAEQKDQEASAFSGWLHRSFDSLEVWLQEQGHQSVQELLEARKKNSDAA